MGIFHFLNRLFKSNTTNDIDILDSICNTTYERVFGKCKLEFGREMIELMNLKRNLMENIKAPNGSTPHQITIAKRIMMLLELYLNLAESCTSLKNNIPDTEQNKDSTLTSFINNTGDMMRKIYVLIGSLNGQFYQNADGLNSSECDTLLSEAEELYRVLKENK